MNEIIKKKEAVNMQAAPHNAVIEDQYAEWDGYFNSSILPSAQCPNVVAHWGVCHIFISTHI